MVKRVLFFREGRYQYCLLFSKETWYNWNTVESFSKHQKHGFQIKEQSYMQLLFIHVCQMNPCPFVDRFWRINRSRRLLKSSLIEMSSSNFAANILINLRRKNKHWACSIKLSSGKHLLAIPTYYKSAADVSNLAKILKISTNESKNIEKSWKH